jgi:hypothetical protein
MFAAFGFEVFKYSIQGPCFFMKPVAAKCVKDIGDGDNSTVDMNVFAFLAVGVSIAIPFFVMIARNDGAGGQNFLLG